MSIFLQVYGGLGIATLVGFLALCNASASRVRHAQTHQGAHIAGEQRFPH